METCQRCNHGEIHAPGCTGVTRKGTPCQCPKWVRPPKSPRTEAQKKLELATIYGSLSQETQDALLAAKFGITPEEAHQMMDNAVDKFMENVRKMGEEWQREVDKHQ